MLRARGFAVCRIDPGTKSPGYKGWSTRSLQPDDFDPDDLIGVIAGPLSNGGSPDRSLVVLDLDSAAAVERADDYLPATGMVEGRPTKPRSHWYYLLRVRSIPDWAVSQAEQAARAARAVAGFAGPFTKSFRHCATGAEVLRFVGTGGQVVCPPSKHPTGEKREWEGGEPGEPAHLTFSELWEPVCRLAHACGCGMPSGLSWPWETAPAPGDPLTRRESTAARGDVIARATAYLAALPPAVSGQGGHDRTFAAARTVVWGFDLGEEVGFRLLKTHFNSRCRPPWSDAELRHKCHDADTHPFDKPRGYLRDAPHPAAPQSGERCGGDRPGTLILTGPDYAVAAEPVGNGKHKVTVTAGGAPAFVDTVNPANAAARKKLLNAVAATMPQIDRASLDAELMKVAATPTAPPPSASQPDFLEVDVGRVVRPELFHTADVSGITVPVRLDSGGKLVARWRTHLRWADGRREVIDTPTRLTLPGGSEVHLHPDPGDPLGGTPAWSSASRRAWLDGAPAPEPAAVFPRVCKEIAYYLDFPDGSAAGTTATLALWTTLSYAYPCWPAVPYLSVGGPAASGKTRLLDVLSRLTFRPLFSSSMTAPSLFRTLHASGGTLLIDEAERLRSTADPGVAELRAVLLAGYRRGGCATRLEPAGDTYRTVKFDVYGPKALACIAGLPPTLASRCVPVGMFRSAVDSPKPTRRIDADPGWWQRLRDDLHVLALEHGAAWCRLAGWADVVPHEIAGRNHELWQPLLALAAWLEDHGADDLLGLVQDHAVETVGAARDDVIPEADEIILEVLAAAVEAGQAPTSADLLRHAQARDEVTFRHWSPKTVTSRLKSYGIACPRKVGGERRYGDVTLNTLRRTAERYGVDLGLTADAYENGHPTQENVPIVPDRPRGPR
jgi:hypothetical protein